MGLMASALGAREVAGAARDLAGVLVGDRAAREAAEAELGQAALAQFGAEFRRAPAGRFDRFMDGLNRLPRPLLVGGTLGLFAHAMVAPESFARRMESLALVPEPLWWLLGAIVSFYFGARELHYARGRSRPAAAATEEPARPGQPFLGALLARAKPAPTPPTPAERAADPNFNAALEEWRATRR
ncbi:MAG: hypothetical protein DI556_19635 [Rhodovulum sulfidophilum]|uniref:Carboxylesterase n=1 Tax=Rhodovulum sulfidophilum TaxID=35806 RepID=A0A2W5N2V1_RHOSU|nr:MAG: hypothetical protein DI556_19635 [Rhodovulum sulfidophilum]